MIDLRLRLRFYFARLPLTDRITFSKELQSSVAYGIFAGLALPLLPIVARTIGMSPAGITLMVTMQFIGSLFGIVVGRLVDRLPKMPFALWPPLIARASLAGLAFVRKPIPYLIIVSFFYLIMNLNGPAYSSIMRTNYSDANRGRLMGNIRIVVVIISGLFSAIGGVILSRNGQLVRWLFLVASVSGVLSSLAFGTIKVRRAPGLPRSPPAVPLRQSLRVVWENKPYVIYNALMFLCALPDKLSIPLEPIWLVDDLHLDYAAASFLLGTIVAAASIGGYLIWARALRRFNSFMVLGLVVLAFAGRYVALGLARSPAQLIPMSILSGLNNAGWDLVPIFCMIQVADPENFSLYIGLNTTLFGIRGLVGPSLGTFLYSSGVLPISGIFLLIGGLIALGGVLLLLYSRRVAQDVRSRTKRRKAYPSAAG